MRTPESDERDADLATGFLFTEGIVESFDQVERIESSDDDQSVTVVFRPGVPVDLCHLKRHFYTTSSCGVCGKTSIDAVSVHLARPIAQAEGVIDGGLVHRLPDQLKDHQAVFAQTGGLHGCGLFSFSGELRHHAEDVGRHNAVDKLIGRALRTDPDAVAETFGSSVLVLSGRISFELVQKSLVAGIPMIVAVGAPSSLAVELADQQGQTLVGFANSQRYNVYCGNQRLT